MQRGTQKTIWITLAVQINPMDATRLSSFETFIEPNCQAINLNCRIGDFQTTSELLLSKSGENDEAEFIYPVFKYFS